MNIKVTTALASVLAVATALPVLAETRTAPGEWQPENAAVLEKLYGCDPNEWVRVTSEASGETLYLNNWTCQPGRSTDRGGNTFSEVTEIEPPIESEG
ncbi:hypothetical protein [Octadecabacter sp. R77987]|uniref:hypothetical protein n=1 Tax=Octadecabacter sp. R77987 TaxID=3093874 RepID=UPI00367088BB